MRSRSISGSSSGSSASTPVTHDRSDLRARGSWPGGARADTSPPRARHHALDPADAVAMTDLDRAERHGVGPEFGETAMVLEARQQWQVERSGLHDEFTDLSRPFRPGRAVDDAETGCCAPSLPVKLRPSTCSPAHTANTTAPRSTACRRPHLRLPSSSEGLRRVFAPSQQVDVATCGRSSSIPTRTISAAIPRQRSRCRTHHGVATVTVGAEQFRKHERDADGALATVAHGFAPDCAHEIGEHGVVRDHIDLWRVESLKALGDGLVPHLADDLRVPQSHREIRRRVRLQPRPFDP